MKRYIAFLRGINVGGHKVIPMSLLVNLFKAIGFEDARSYIASGNIIFSADSDDEVLLTTKIEEVLEHGVGYPITVFLRSQEELRALIAKKPFQNHTGREKTKLYVSFLTKVTPVEIKLPLVSTTEGYEIVALTDREVCSVSTLLPNDHYGSSIKFIEKNLTKLSTTRNWNTILKVAQF